MRITGSRGCVHNLDKICLSGRPRRGLRLVIMRTLIEKLEGHGRVEKDGKALSRVEYTINVLRDPDSLFPLYALSIHSSTPELPIGPDRLTLAMTDGRKLDFFLIGPGRPKATNALY